jgi:UvrB/uvrC motif
VMGSELDAGLEELRLIRELRPPANARSARPDRYLYLRRKGDSVVCSEGPTELGPIRSRRRAQLAARALQGVEWESPADALPLVRARLARLARDQRFEDAARLRDRLAALEEVVADLAHLERLRRLEICIVAPALEEGRRRGFFVAKGRIVCVRPLPDLHGLEWQAGLAAVARAERTAAPETTDELLLVGSFLRRPPPELQVVRLEPGSFCEPGS